MNTTHQSSTDGLEPDFGPRKGTKTQKKQWFMALAQVISLLVAIFLIAFATLWWWAGTDGSLAHAIRLAQSCCGAPLQPLTAQGTSGALRSGGHIDQLVWLQDGLRVDARDVSVKWQPWSLLQGTLKLDSLAAASVDIDDQRPPSLASKGPPNALGLPVLVGLDTFSVNLLRLTGTSMPTAFEVSNLSGRYRFDGIHHQLELARADIASGSYRGRAALSSASPLTLDASLSGGVALLVPNTKTVLALSFIAAARGPLTALQVNAVLQTTVPASATASISKTRTATPPQPQATLTATITPWAAQPVPQADANFRDLNIAALWPGAPQTLLTGSASVRPLTFTSATTPTTSSAASTTWAIQLQTTNSLPGPWDQQRLPIDSLQGVAEWRSGSAMVKSLKAIAGGGELLASGQWADAADAASPGKANTTPAWKLQATLKNIDPARLHSQLAALPLDGVAVLRSQGLAIGFDASVQPATGSIKASKQPSKSTHAAKQGTTLGQLRLQSASATGSWNAAQEGGTLVLSDLRIKTDEAELSGELEAQPAARGGKGRLALTAPGLAANIKGELRPTTGEGELALRASNIAQSLAWLRKLPGLPAGIKTALNDTLASGNGELSTRWQGGWQDPALQARLSLPVLDLRTSSVAATSSVATSTTSSASVTRLRDIQATLSGRLSQAQFTTQGRIETGQRKYRLQLAGDAGRMVAGAVAQISSWQGLVKQLDVSVEDPALGAGSWRLATRAPVALKWTPTNSATSSSTKSASIGVFEAGAGQALLTAPNTSANTTPTAASAATIAWQPIRWRAGEFTSAGKVTGLPMAWLELFAGPQMAGLGLSGNLVFDGEWDARLAETLNLKASLARSSGDISVLTETIQGSTARVAAGVRQARVSLLSEGDALTLALRWESERAGTAEGQLKTRLTRTAGAADNTAMSLGGWLWAADAPLSGQLRAQLPRIGVWSVLAPPGWRIRGSLGADIAITGTRAAPLLTGELQANDLALRSVVDGIEFGNGRLRATLLGERMRITEFTLQGAGDKGTGGTLTAQGEAAWLNGQPGVRLDAKLSRLRASIRTDRQVTLSGNVQASLEGKRTELNGSLKVDQARILLPEEGTPQLGDDVVVRSIAGAAAGQKAPAETSSPKTVKAQPLQAASVFKVAVAVDLGQDFRVQGKGLDTQLRGSLVLAANSLTEPRLTGTVNTYGGQYRAYGQRLDVEQGVLRFTGAIDNPSLDILAIRPNLTQRVGVQITGTALLPRVRLYAQPELSDGEKLSWLVLGRSSATGGGEAALLQQAGLALLGSKGGGMSGGLAASLGLDELSYRGASSNADGTTTEGAVTLGKRFSRNFYAAYERSVSGALGTLFVFYDLSQRFTIRAQAGQQSAVDLIFTVPYD